MYICVMEIFSIEPEEYAAEFDRYAPHVYNTVGFNLHNAAKTERLHFLALADRKLRFGLIAGERDGELRSPFSAPFGGLTARSRQSVEHLYAAAEALKRYATRKEMTLAITLPPPIYAPSLTAGQAAALGSVGLLQAPDLNYHVELDFTPGDAASKLTSSRSRNGRNVAMRNGRLIRMFDHTDRAGARRAYNVIEANHLALGHPLRMSFDEVMATAPLTGSRFLVMEQQGQDVAAAMINEPAAGIGQVIYWGDHPSARASHPMNLFATDVMEWALEHSMTRLDIGPSSELGKPAMGLCRFKESIGCALTLKRSIIIEP